MQRSMSQSTQASNGNNERAYGGFVALEEEEFGYGTQIARRRGGYDIEHERSGTSLGR